MKVFVPASVVLLAKKLTEEEHDQLLEDTAWEVGKVFDTMLLSFLKKKGINLTLRTSKSDTNSINEFVEKLNKIGFKTTFNGKDGKYLSTGLSKGEIEINFNFDTKKKSLWTSFHFSDNYTDDIVGMVNNDKMPSEKVMKNFVTKVLKKNGIK